MHTKRVLAVALALGLIAPAAPAASIQSIGEPDGPGLGTYTPGQIDPAVDDQSELFAFWDFGLLYEAPGYIDLPIVADLAGPVATEYNLFASIDNRSGVEWIGLRVLLGFGSGDGFTPSPAADGLDFDTPDRDSLGVISTTAFDFAPSTYEEDELVFSGGSPLLSGPGQFTDLAFAIDIPQVSAFTIRFEPIVQSPSVPAPAAAVPTALGLAATLGFRRRRSS